MPIQFSQIALCGNIIIECCAEGFNESIGLRFVNACGFQGFHRFMCVKYNRCYGILNTGYVRASRKPENAGRSGFPDANTDLAGNLLRR